MTPPCPLNVSSETLSAWRSRLLPATQQRDLDRHIPTCPACQRELDRFDRIADALRTPPQMPSQASVWAGVATYITTSQRGHMTKSQKTLMLTGLGTTAVVVTLLAVVLVALTNRGTQPVSVTPTGTAIVTPTLTATPAPLSNWSTVQSLADAKGMAFGKSDPFTGYACIVSHVSGNPSGVKVTHDGGATWGKTLAAPTGLNCSVLVNPYNSKEVVFRVLQCYSGCDEYGKYYRSLDGGNTWIALTEPSPNQGLDNLTNPLWTPTALYMRACYCMSVGGDLPTPDHFVAVSVKGGLLQWTTANPIAEVFGIAFVDGNAYSVYSSGQFVTTTDNGATWTKPITSSPSLTEIQSTYTNHTLIGSLTNGGFFVSKDSGQTWQTISAFPLSSAQSRMSAMYYIPDGALLGVSNIGELYIFASGATQWRLLARLPVSPIYVETPFLAFSWDANGHIAKLWASINTGTENSPQTVTQVISLTS